MAYPNLEALLRGRLKNHFRQERLKSEDGAALSVSTTKTLARIRLSQLVQEYEFLMNVPKKIFRAKPDFKALMAIAGPQIAARRERVEAEETERSRRRDWTLHDFMDDTDEGAGPDYN